MNCGDASAALGPSLDGELGFVERVRFRRHLASCIACAAAFRRHEVEQTARRGELPRYAAPTALVAALTARFGDRVAPLVDERAARRRWLVVGATAGCLATLVATVGIGALRDVRDDAGLAQAAVAAHTRATLGEALVQVDSADHHTVKPWLSARLDYSPPVVARVAGPAAGGRGDEDGAGDVENACVLTGARLDVLAGRRVAVLVYRYRAHVVDVFVWPDGGGSDRGTDTTIRGFNVRQGHGHAMRWLAVSDVNDAVLDALVTALAH